MAAASLLASAAIGQDAATLTIDLAQVKAHTVPGFAIQVLEFKAR